MSKQHNDVGKFHKRFGLPTSESLRKPTYLRREAIMFRLRFLFEELGELADAYGIQAIVELKPKIDAGLDFQDMPKIADSLIDLAYVVHGTAHMHGLPWDKLWQEVQRANMLKERARTDGLNSTRSSSLDVVKPEGWKPPRIEDVLLRAGWPGHRLPGIEED